MKKTAVIVLGVTLTLASLMPLWAQDNPFPVGNRTINGNLRVVGNITTTGTVTPLQDKFTLLSGLADGPVVATTPYYLAPSGLAITNYLAYAHVAQYAIGGASGMWVSNFIGGITAIGGVAGTGSGNTTNLAAILFTNGVATAMTWTNQDASGVGAWTNDNAGAHAFWLTNGSTWAIQFLTSAVLPARSTLSFAIQGYRQ